VLFWHPRVSRVVSWCVEAEDSDVVSLSCPNRATKSRSTDRTEADWPDALRFSRLG